MRSLELLFLLLRVHVAVDDLLEHGEQLVGDVDPTAALALVHVRGQVAGLGVGCRRRGHVAARVGSAEGNLRPLVLGPHVRLVVRVLRGRHVVRLLDSLLTLLQLPLVQALGRCGFTHEVDAANVSHGLDDLAARVLVHIAEGILGAAEEVGLLLGHVEDRLGQRVRRDVVQLLCEDSPLVLVDAPHLAEPRGQGTRAASRVAVRVGMVDVDHRPLVELAVHPVRGVAAVLVLGFPAEDHHVVDDVVLAVHAEGGFLKVHVFAEHGGLGNVLLAKVPIDGPDGLRSNVAQVDNHG